MTTTLHYNRSLDFLKRVFLSEDNIYKIIRSYKNITGEEKAEKKVLDSIGEFFDSKSGKIGNEYDGNVVNWVEKLNKDFLLELVVARKTPIATKTGYRKTTFFGMEDWKTCPPLPGPINAILGGTRNSNYIRHNTVKSETAKVSKLELDVRRLETGNMTKKITPWEEQYLKVKSESKNKYANKPNIREEYNYDLY